MIRAALILASLMATPTALTAPSAPQSSGLGRIFSAEEFNREIMRYSRTPASRVQYAAPHSKNFGALNVSYSAARVGDHIGAVIVLTNPTRKMYCFEMKANITVSDARGRTMDDVTNKPLVIYPRGSLVVLRTNHTNAGRYSGVDASYALIAWVGDMSKPSGTGQRCGPNEPREYRDWKRVPLSRGWNLVLD